jgi:F-type H+-transporting ATPase subunit d
LQALKEQKVDVDFSHYKSVLKNQSVVSQAEKILKDFKPVTYDVSAHLKAIDAFEAKAVSVHLRDAKEGVLTNMLSLE